MKKILFPVFMLLLIVSIVQAGSHFSSIGTCYQDNPCADSKGQKAKCFVEAGASAATGTGGNVKGGGPCAECYILNNLNIAYIKTGQPCGAARARGNPADE